MYNPLDKAYKSITGAVPENVPVTFSVKTSLPCSMCIVKDGEDKVVYPMQQNGDFFTKEISFSRGLYFYYFETVEGKILCNDDHLGSLNCGKNFQLTVYKKGYKTPNWLKGGIIYQIFPDRFYRGEKNKPKLNGRIIKNWGENPSFLPNEKGIVLNNDFFGGDFKGITKKLNYLKSLSVNAIYLNPVFKANSNHRYDTGDYSCFDPYLGTEKDFLKLIKKAKSLGINVILDGVFNHTGDDSIYFNKYGNYDSLGAYQNKNSKFYKWYNFNNFPNEYECWWGIKILPMINKDSKPFQKFIAGKNGVIQKYTDLGVCGFRLDVVDELSDTFVKNIRKRLKLSNKNAVLIGEVWEDATNKIAYGTRKKYFLGDELDSVMNYPLKDAILNFVTAGDSKLLSETVKSQIDRFPKQSLNVLMNLLASHDTYRLISAVSGADIDGENKQLAIDYVLDEYAYNLAVKRLKIAVTAVYTMYGVPSVYYGDEIGMQGYRDPLNRKCFTWDNIDKDLLSFYKKLGKIRSSYSCFKDGEMEEIYSKEGIYAYKRANNDCEVLTVLNAKDKEIKLSFNGKLKSLVNGKIYNKKYLVKKQSYDILIAI